MKNILAAVFAVALCACSSGNASSDGSSDNDSIVRSDTSMVEEPYSEDAFYDPEAEIGSDIDESVYHYDYDEGPSLSGYMPQVGDRFAYTGELGHVNSSNPDEIKVTGRISGEFTITTESIGSDGLEDWTFEGTLTMECYDYDKEEDCVWTVDMDGSLSISDLRYFSMAINASDNARAKGYYGLYETLYFSSWSKANLNYMTQEYRSGTRNKLYIEKI